MTFKQILLVALLSFFTASGLGAQTSRGISSDGRDFFIGYMPGIRHPGGWTGYSETYFVLICSYQDNNPVTISYFGDDGVEYTGITKVLTKGRCQQIPLVGGQITPTRPGEVLEYKAAHIKSRYPVSVQCYDEGSSAGGMYQAIPTSALGKSYVIASWFDSPVKNNPGWMKFDSSSSEFMIIAPYNNTSVTFIPNSTTYGGVPGYKSGSGSDGMPHPKTIKMQKGQVYWVRSFAVDSSADMSGSSVVSDKPVAVLAGQERALLGDPSGWWPSLDIEIRDVMVEQMTPVEDWGIDYPSIPFMPSTGSTPRFNALLRAGEGNMYRIFASDVAGGFMNMTTGTPLATYPTGVNLYQHPAAQYDNIVDPVDLHVDGKSVDSTGALKKMYVVMYDYYQGAHDSSPGGLADGKTSDDNAQGGGGETTQDAWTYKTPNEMNLVPVDRWRSNYIFKVPQNATYRGYQFVNIITNKDSLAKIVVMRNGLNPASLGAITPTKTYPIPSHRELTGLTLKLVPGDYLINGNTPLACYSYGRTETTYKDGWGYAAPCGQYYGSRSESNAPQADIKSSCGQWNVRLHDSGPKATGIADMMLLDDPDGYYSKPGHVSFNVKLVPTEPLSSTTFTPGDTNLSFSIQVSNPTQDAYAAIYAIDRAGNDTIFEMHYSAHKIVTTPQALQFTDAMVGTQVCTTFTIKNLSSDGSAADTIGTPVWLFNDKSNYGPDVTRKSPTFSWTSATKLPAALRAGDSVVISVCFAPTDTLNMRDTNNRLISGHTDILAIGIGCGMDTIPVVGKGITPIIDASDLDFGTVRYGDSLCRPLTVRNTGNALLILDTNWVMQNNPRFTFNDQALLPDSILPGQTSKLQFCFRPMSTSESDSRIDWSTNIPGEYAHLKKDVSYLTANRQSNVTAGKQESLSIDALTPNPSDGEITLFFHSRQAVKIHVFDVLGHEVRATVANGSGGQSMRLSMTGLPAGSYFVRISSEGETRTARVEIR